MKTVRTSSLLIAALSTLILAGSPLLTHATELKSLSWSKDTDTTFLRIDMDGQAAHSTEILDRGRRLRVSFDDTTLNNSAVDITGEGAVKGVFPYLADNGQAVHVDLLMREPGTLVVQPTEYGFMVKPMIGGKLATTGSPPAATTNATADTPSVSAKPKPVMIAQASGQDVQSLPSNAPPAVNVIQDIKFSPLPGGRVQINIRTASRPDTPGSFSTNKPARLAFDFFGARSALPRNVIKVKSGAVESIATVETDDRTRIVLNLVRPVSYDTQITDNGMVLIIESVTTGISRTVTPKTTRFAKGSETTTHNIDRVDFRRNKEGGGKIIVELSDPTVGIDIREEAGEIIVDFLDAKIRSELERRLDVVDFATPVQSIDTFQQGKHVRMVVLPTGSYEHLAYQAGNVFTINVNPIVKEEKEVKKDEFGYSGERLSLNFQKISVRAALQVIADFTGLNFVTSDSVKGELTLRLKDVPWDQALDIILQTRGLGMRQKGNVVWVAPANEIASRERAELEASQQVVELEPLISELIQVNYAKADDIAKLLRSIKAVDTGVQQSLFGSVSIAQVETVSNSLLSPRGNVTVDGRTNSILIQDTARKIAEVRKLIAKLDKPVRQVLIETRIVEANDNFSRELGARFGFQRLTTDARFPGIKDSNIGDVITSGTFAGTETIADSLNDDEPGLIFETLPDGLAVNLPAAGIGNDPAASYVFEIFKAGTGFAHLLSLELSALEAEGQGKLIANPRLITANQKEAHIEQGQERVFTTNVLGVGSVVTKKAVLGLTVTPQITPDDNIIMDVFITQDSFVGDGTDTINTKQVRTQVLLENGETAVIGGIYQQDEARGVSKVPILGDIPVLGALFRKKTVRDNRIELLIFLTPRIISPALNIG